MGRHGVNSAALALRLDTNLPDLNRPHTASLTHDELSDENTALTRKLAHLEAQLIALQKRNVEIDTERAGAPANKAPSPSSRSAQWPLYLLIVGLLVAAGALIAWLRRRGHGTPAAVHFPGPTAFPGLDSITSGSLEKPLPSRDQTFPEFERIFEFPSSAQTPTTEIKDDILDQAELYMAHGHGDLAVHLLHEHLREAPDESPVPWLLLPDLLQREGNTEGCTAASTECRSRFNVNLNGHPVSQGDESSHGLEDYPHLLEQLVVVWGSPIIENFFDGPIYDKRGATRIGFDPGAYRDILMLRAISRDILPLAA